MIKSDPMYSIVYHKPEGLVRLKWLPGTAAMTDQDFKETLEAFAESILQHHAQRLVIDVLEFKGRPSPEVLAWRDEVTVPKYHKAGVQKVAWVWPGQTPGNAAASAKEKFENHFYPTEAEALAWVTK